MPTAEQTRSDDCDIVQAHRRVQRPMPSAFVRVLAASSRLDTPFATNRVSHRASGSLGAGVQVENIESVIGAQRALDLSFGSETHELAAEAWNAQLFALSDPEDDHSPLDRELIASAAIVRVNRWDDDWLDSLDAVSGDLQQVGEAFLDEDVIMGVDEDSVFASSLVILDFVGVPEQHRGSGNSLALARGVAHIFRNDIVALMPAELSRDEAGELVLDLAKRDALRAHWIKGGFIEIPGTSVLMLPFSAKDGCGSSE